MTGFDACNQVLRGRNWLVPDFDWQERQPDTGRWQEPATREMTRTLSRLNRPAHTVQRRALGNLFDRGTLETMRPQIADHVTRLLDRLDRRLRSYGAADLRHHRRRAAADPHRRPVAGHPGRALTRTSWTSPTARCTPRNCSPPRAILAISAQATPGDAGLLHRPPRPSARPPRQRCPLGLDPSLGRPVPRRPRGGRPDAVRPGRCSSPSPPGDHRDPAHQRGVVPHPGPRPGRLPAPEPRAHRRRDRRGAALLTRRSTSTPASPRTTPCSPAYPSQKDTTVHVLYGAANHDPRRNHQPHVFDIRRKGGHLTFWRRRPLLPRLGLARLEARQLLTQLLERFPTLRPTAGPTYAHWMVFRRITSLYVTA
ncbi:cytochrome P450 [Streptomyces tricolor]|nr:cytochrome P450 [Streptomyces tricolor]